MRFEIRAGGALVILLGLAMLSGGVFALGLIAGYGMAGSNAVNRSQLATNYPAPNPNAAQPTAMTTSGTEGIYPPAEAPASKLSAVSPALHKVAPPSQPQPNPIAEAVPPPPNTAPPGPPPGETASASAQPPPAAAVARNVSAAPTSAARPSSAKKVAAAAPTPVRKRRPYNIQIDAVMDRGGAEQMYSRLRRLGYNPTILPTQIAGQTWYRVRVGPYATQEEAQEAQDRLRQQYEAAYGKVGSQ